MSAGLGQGMKANMRKVSFSYYHFAQYLVIDYPRSFRKRISRNASVVKNRK